MCSSAIMLHAQGNKIHTQDKWEVVKIRGKIYKDNKIITEGTMLSENEPFTFTKTSDVMLLQDDQQDDCFFVKPTNFCVQENEGRSILIKKNINDYKKGERKYLYVVSAKHSTRIRQCDGLLEKIFKSSNNNLGICREYHIDYKWENYNIVRMENYLYPNITIDTSDVIASLFCEYKLVFSPLGNLILKKLNFKIWETNVNAGYGGYCKMGENGNFVIYKSKDEPIWATSTYSKDCSCSYLFLSNDGNLEIITPNGKTTWQTRTWEGSINTNTLGHVVKLPDPKFNPVLKYQIRPVDGNQRLGVNMTSDIKGAPVLQALGNKNKQQWNIALAPDQHYYTLQPTTINYLGIAGNVLQVALFKNTPDQKWDIAPTEDEGQFFIRNTANGYYLSVYNNSIKLAPFTGEKNQMWEIEAVK